ncbi:glycosyltransferase [Arthrobacter sp. RIT-PI-e]|uniref:glycosyltransferase n=1 Tax=Arthrobacter sp. RIT-PI-e TaxID=1681197 RepID=UPI0009E26900|nr:glycosyltransferase family 2 protein [Arthrobacter sp. RIT-PI-e]
MLLSVIVPTFNEAGNIEELLRRIDTACRGIDAEVIVVDDSSDTTPQEVERYASGVLVPVHLHHRDKPEGGLSGAVVAGVTASSATYCLVMDGDLQHPPELIPVLLAQLERESADVAVASRYCGAGGNNDGLANAYRKLVSTGVTTVTRALFPVRLRHCTDPMTGFFAFRRSQVDLASLHPNGFKILLEILVRNRLKVTEVPFVFAERTAGESKATLNQGLRFLRQLGELRAGRVGLFAVVGGIGTVLNLLIMGCLLAFGVHYVPAAIVAAELTILTNFVMQEKLVFAGDRRTESAVRTRFLQSVGFNNVEALLRMPVLVLLVEMLAFNSILAQAGTLAVAFVVRYMFHAKVVYRKRDTTPDLVGVGETEAVATAPAAADELLLDPEPGRGVPAADPDLGGSAVDPGRANVAAGAAGTTGAVTGVRAGRRAAAVEPGQDDDVTGQVREPVGRHRLRAVAPPALPVSLVQAEDAVIAPFTAQRQAPP